MYMQERKKDQADHKGARSGEKKRKEKIKKEKKR